MESTIGLRGGDLYKSNLGDNKVYLSGGGRTLFCFSQTNEQQKTYLGRGLKGTEIPQGAPGSRADRPRQETTALGMKQDANGVFTTPLFAGPTWYTRLGSGRSASTRRCDTVDTTDATTGIPYTKRKRLI